MALATKDQWLFYTTFADMPVALAGVLWTLWYAKPRARTA